MATKSEASHDAHKTPASAPAASPAAATSAHTNTFALVGFILSLASFVFLVTAIPGIVLGHLGLHQIKKTGEQGRGMAIAALIVGYIQVGLVALIVVIVMIFLILGFIAAANNGGHWDYSINN